MLNWGVEESEHLDIITSGDREAQLHEIKMHHLPPVSPVSVRYGTGRGVDELR